MNYIKILKYIPYLCESEERKGFQCVQSPEPWSYAMESSS